MFLHFQWKKKLFTSSILGYFFFPFSKAIYFPFLLSLLWVCLSCKFIFIFNDNNIITTCDIQCSSTVETCRWTKPKNKRKPKILPFRLHICHLSPGCVWRILWKRAMESNRNEALYTIWRSFKRRMSFNYILRLFDNYALVCAPPRTHCTQSSFL